VGANPAAVANHNIGLDVGKGLNSDILTQLCLGVNVSQITNHNPFVRVKVFSSLFFSTL
jgi:hypothetical protein